MIGFERPPGRREEYNDRPSSDCPGRSASRLSRRSAESLFFPVVPSSREESSSSDEFSSTIQESIKLIVQHGGLSKATGAAHMPEERSPGRFLGRTVSPIASPSPRARYYRTFRLIVVYLLALLTHFTTAFRPLEGNKHSALTHRAAQLIRECFEIRVSTKQHYPPRPIGGPGRGCSGRAATSGLAAVRTRLRRAAEVVCTSPVDRFVIFLTLVNLSFTLYNSALRY